MLWLFDSGDDVSIAYGWDFIFESKGKLCRKSTSNTCGKLRITSFGGLMPNTARDKKSTADTSQTYPPKP